LSHQTFSPTAHPLCNLSTTSSSPYTPPFISPTVRRQTMQFVYLLSLPWIHFSLASPVYPLDVIRIPYHLQRPLEMRKPVLLKAFVLSSIVALSACGGGGDDPQASASEGRQRALGFSAAQTTSNSPVTQAELGQAPIKVGTVANVNGGLRPVVAVVSPTSNRWYDFYSAGSSPTNMSGMYAGFRQMVAGLVTHLDVSRYESTSNKVPIAKESNQAFVSTNSSGVPVVDTDGSTIYGLQGTVGFGSGASSSLAFNVSNLPATSRASFNSANLTGTYVGTIRQISDGVDPIPSRAIVFTVDSAGAIRGSVGDTANEVFSPSYGWTISPTVRCHVTGSVTPNETATFGNVFLSVEHTGNPADCTASGALLTGVLANDTVPGWRVLGAHSTLGPTMGGKAVIANLQLQYIPPNGSAP
jgi:hypothetical protein